MKRSIIAFCLLSIAVVSCNNADKKETSATATADTSVKGTNATANTSAAPMPDSATMMKNWQEYMTPGDVHKMIASWNGVWNGEVSMWETPTGKPSMSKMTATNKMIMGGRYQVTTNVGQMMGMPFEGQSMLAYDNAKKVFISTWVDNFGTGLMSMQGVWDAATKSINFKGSMVDPSAGDGREHSFRETFTVIDDKTQLMEMFGPGPDGKEFKTMEIKLTRK